MKKLVAAACCVFLISSFSKTSAIHSSDPKTNGQKYLVKAIAVIVNTESNKKLPPRKIFVAAKEAPWE